MGTRCRPSEDRYDKKDLANREFAYVYTYISNEYASKYNISKDTMNTFYLKQLFVIY